MSLGERLLNLRKEKHLSQEEAAEKLNVTRQTISKWETDQSTPDFDKIVPLCNLYGITTDELLTGEKKEKNISNNIDVDNSLMAKKRAKGIGLAVMLYFLAVIWVIVSIEAFKINEVVSIGIFLLIVGIATCIIIYTCMVYHGVNHEDNEKDDNKNQLFKRIESILALIVLIIYLFISFMTMAWNITWLIWIVFALIMEIVKLIFTLRGQYEEE